MSDLISTFGDGIGEVIGSPAVQLAIRAVVIYLVALWLAAAFTVWRDLGRRFRSPLPAYIGAAAIVVATPVLFPAVWLVIRMIRPEQTIDERESEAMELALLARDAPERCPGCDMAVHADWLVCPSCHARLARRCADCDGVLKPLWDICPWCAADLSPGVVPEPVVLPVPAASAAAQGATSRVPDLVAPQNEATAI